MAEEELIVLYLLPNGNRTNKLKYPEIDRRRRDAEKVTFYKLSWRSENQ